MKKYLLTGIVVIGSAILGGWILNAPSPGLNSASPETADTIAGATLYNENCASCHGDNLQGQADWQSPGEDGRLPAPPHDITGHTWHHSDGLLFSYTKFGGKQVMAQSGVDFNSGMPGFGDQLSDQQILEILAYIKSTWPERQKNVQAQRSEAERLQKDENQ